MSVAVELTVPGDSFELGDVLTAVEGVTVEIERVVPVRERIIPYAWAQGEGHDVEEAFLDLPAIESVQQLTEIDEWGLYELRWRHPIDGLVASLAESDAAVVEFASTDGEWYLDLRFPSREAVTVFYESCHEKGISITVTRIKDGVSPADRSELTGKQHESLVTAYQSGYFDIPRRITLTDLAKQMDISAQALSQRLRRGSATLVRESLVDQKDRSFDTPPK